MTEVRFSLMTEDGVLTAKQQDKIKEVIENYNSGIGILKEIKLMDMTETGFKVQVKESSNQWHNWFSKRICNEAKLRDLRIYVKSNKTRLFKAEEVE